MAVSRLLIDPSTQTRLGAEVLAELRANLWPVDCQTCGRPFGRWEKPALAVQEVANIADVSLHHRGCRKPRWLEYSPATEAEFSAFPHVTWRANPFLLRITNALVVLINPYLEYASLRRDDARWRVATLDRFAAVGMGTDRFDAVIARPALSLVVDEDRVSAHITDGAGKAHGWHFPISPPAREVLDAKEWHTIGVTTALDLRKRLRKNPLRALIAARQVLLGAARRTYTERAQLLGDSDFDRKSRIELIGLISEMIRRTLGIQVGRDQLAAAVACSMGDSGMLLRLSGRDKLASALVVAQLYATRSRTSAGEPGHGGGVHVMAPDPAIVDECFDMCTAVSEISGLTVARLAVEPTVEQRSTEYLADIVIGMPEQFRAAYAFYRDGEDDWGLHETRGRLAMAIGAEARHRAGDVIRRYPKVTVV
ncbi:hypothetical protein HUO13_15475 [Saccharopolyspora erythraea]|uniref:hypothetical protein n=1 Tax=Saccharopolyspora erythraea TaxID=1836 RepID=UPI001BAD962F|nr:hypothetical protein [Saccharopolyspora erythraea]QUH02014.1 hypothetical protein HUO13_15475 [Saccharopolyspora erythraea]